MTEQLTAPTPGTPPEPDATPAARKLPRALTPFRHVTTNKRKYYRGQKNFHFAN
jgi:hypothetical protein